MHLRFRATAGVSAVASVLALSGLVNPVAANAATAPSATGAQSSVTPATVAPSSTLPAAAKAASLPPGTEQECPPPASPLQEQCQLFVHGAAQPGGTVSPAAVKLPYGPSDLRAAYGLTSASANDGRGETVAVVDAFRDPYIQSDLRTYRNDMGLPLCRSATSPAGCLTVMNQWGNTDPAKLPARKNAGWEDETALDVEMVLAICPNCHIDLFEANSDSLADMGRAENSAAKAADFISNSWSGLDFPGESAYDTKYFNHPGRALVFASGDYRYGASYPASSQLVTSVGGTYLTQNSGGAWVQSVWSGQQTGSGTGTGGGCSSGEPKPAWQSDPGCADRTQNDVAAVASGPHGIYFYSTPSSNSCGGLCQAYGTSVATPIITATYALAGTPASNTYPASYPYQNPADLTHITSGTNGPCESDRRYLCDAGSSLSDGYNGPTGLGTPNGANLAPFKNTATGDVVSVISPGTYDLQVGRGYHLPAVKAYDTLGSGQNKTWTYKINKGMPSGLSMNHSTGAIAGRVKSPVNEVFRLTVSDGTASATVSFRIVAVKSMITSYHPGNGAIRLDLGHMCVNDAGNRSANGTKVRVWKCNGSASEDWRYLPSGEPGGAGTVRIHGKCLNVEHKGTRNGSRLILYRCDGNASQDWLITGMAGQLYNPVSGKCVNDPGGSTRNGKWLLIWSCNGSARQAWTLPASPVTSGVTGKCVNDAHNSSRDRTHIVSWKCNGYAQQRFTVALDGTLRIHGKCLNVVGQRTLDGSVVNLYACRSNFPAEYWMLAANGMILNPYSGKCLAIPGNGTRNGRWLRLEDCSGQPGEIWAVS